MWEDQRIVARTRYRDLISALRFVARQELIFGLHVHVGLDDPDKAIHVANGMRVHLPGAAGAERQLAVLARRRDRPAVDAHADLPRLPARRHPAAPTATGSDYERADRVHGRAAASWRTTRTSGTTCGPHPQLRHGRDPRRATRRRASSTRSALAALIQAMVKELAEHYDAGRAALATTRGRCSTRTSGWRRATASTASSSTCRRASACATQDARARGCSTACASTPRTSARRPSSTGSRTCSTRGNGAARQLVVYEANHDLREVMAEIVDGDGRLTRVTPIRDRRRAVALGGRSRHGGARSLRRLQELRVRGQPVHHRVPVLRHAAAQAGAEDRARRDAEPSRARPRGPRRSAAAPRLGRCGRARSRASAPTRRAGRTRRSRSSVAVALRLPARWRRSPTARRRASSARSTASGGGSPRRRSSTTTSGTSSPRVARDRALRLAARAPPRPARRRCVLFVARRRRRRSRVAAALDDDRRSPSAATAPRSALLAAWAVPDLLRRRARRGRRRRPARRGGHRGRARCCMPLAVDARRASSPALGGLAGRRCSPALLLARAPSSACAGERSAPWPSARALHRRAGRRRRRARSSDPERLRATRRRSSRTRRPGLQRVLDEALARGRLVRRGARGPGRARPRAARTPSSGERAVRTLVAEETRLGMLVGVAVGLELARELRRPRSDHRRRGDLKPWSIRFLGHAAFALTHEGTTVLVDPFLTGNPKAAADADEVEADADPAHPRPRRPPRRHRRDREAHGRAGRRDRRAGRRDRRRARRRPRRPRPEPRRHGRVRLGLGAR